MDFFKRLFICFLVLTFLNTVVHGQGLTGKWRWQVKGTDKDIQSDYLVELDLKQEGAAVFGTRTLYLKDFKNVVVWMKGEINSLGNLNMESTKIIEYNLPDSILVAKGFTFELRWDKADKDKLTGAYMPKEDPDKMWMRKLDPNFYDVIYKLPVKSRFIRLADTVSKSFQAIITKERGPDPKRLLSPADPVKTSPKITPPLETEVEHVLTIPAADVHIELYDNGTIDGDIVTVLVNGEVRTQHEKLGLKPIVIDIKKEDLKDSTMIIMQAENLGDIPPNTALMLITVAGKRYDLPVSSTMEKRAAVILRKQKEPVKAK